MNIPYRIRLEHGRISEQNDCCVIESLAPSITWAVAGMADDNYQKAYRILSLIHIYMCIRDRLRRTSPISLEDVYLYYLKKTAQR